MRVKSLFFVCLVFLTATTAFTQVKKPISKDGLIKAAKVDGIHYYDIGKSRSESAVVFIHGWTCNADFWKDNYNAFPSYRVLALDLPGHGRSDKPKVDYSMEYFARAVNTVMKNAGVKKAVLIGHSMGTPVARQFYRLYPSQTLGIVSVDGALISFFSKEAMDQFFAPLRVDYPTNAAKFVDGMLTPIKDEALKKFIRENMLATPAHVGISAMEGMADERIWTPDKIEVPVLAIMAPSPFWPKDVKEKFSAIAPKMEFHMWADVSHFLHMEKPAEFNETVRTFITRNKLL